MFIENDKFIQLISCLTYISNALILNRNKQKCNKIKDKKMLTIYI